MERDSDGRETRTRIAARVCIASHRIDRGEIKAGCIRECSEIRNRRRGLGNAGGVGRASSEKNLFLSPPTPPRLLVSLPFPNRISSDELLGKSSAHAFRHAA